VGKRAVMFSLSSCFNVCTLGQFSLTQDQLKHLVITSCLQEESNAETSDLK
jgi:hypothetical protein